MEMDDTQYMLKKNTAWPEAVKMCIQKYKILFLLIGCKMFISYSDICKRASAQLVEACDGNHQLWSSTPGLHRKTKNLLVCLISKA